MEHLVTRMKMVNHFNVGQGALIPNLVEEKICKGFLVQGIFSFWDL